MSAVAPLTLADAQILLETRNVALRAAEQALALAQRDYQDARRIVGWLT